MGFVEKYGLSASDPKFDSNSTIQCFFSRFWIVSLGLLEYIKLKTTFKFNGMTFGRGSKIALTVASF